MRNPTPIMAAVEVLQVYFSSFVKGSGTEREQKCREEIIKEDLERWKGTNHIYFMTAKDLVKKHPNANREITLLAMQKISKERKR